RGGGRGGRRGARRARARDAAGVQTGRLFRRAQLSRAPCGAIARRPMSDRERLLALQQAAAPLEPDAAARASLAGLTVDHVQAFLTGLEDGPSYADWTGANAAALAAPFAETGRDPEDVLAEFDTCVARPGIATASGRFTGYIPGGGLFHAALGDFLAA